MHGAAGIVPPVQDNHINMDEIQYISVDGKPQFAVVPIELWNRLSALPEAALASSLVHDALHAGHHPLKAWRHARRMTHQELASASGVGRSYIALIETDRRAGTLEVFERLGRALNVAPNALQRKDSAVPLQSGRRKAAAAKPLPTDKPAKSRTKR